MHKKYKLSITQDYCHDWTVENAIRELLQNWLDSDGENGYTYTDGVLALNNYNITIPAKTMLMGCTSKRDDDGSVGGKGEGYKIACAVLLREGLDVNIYNGDVTWTPAFEYDDTYGTEVLVFNENSTPNNYGLTFVISGITDDVWEVVVSQNLYLRDDVKDTVEGSDCTVICSFPGKIFVGGLYVCEAPGFKYSYDFKPHALQLNRDRKSVSDWDLNWATAKVLQEVLTSEDVAALLRDNIKDVQYIQHMASTAVKKACADLFFQDNENIIIAEYESDKEQLSQAYKGTPTILDSPVFGVVIKQASEYGKYLSSVGKEGYEEDDRTPLDILELLEEYITCDKGYDLYQSIKSTFETKGVLWDNETEDIPF